MTSTSAVRSRSLIVAAAALTLWTQGCTSYQPPRHASLAPNSYVRVRASVPFHVLPHSPTDGSLRVACPMTHVEGRVRETRGDTTYLVRITRSVPASKQDRACVFPWGTMLALPGAHVPAPAISEQRFDGPRTLLFLGTLGAFFLTLNTMLSF